MDMNDYQSMARTTAIYPKEQSLVYPLLGLVGEVGEFANKYKKVIRDNAMFLQEDMEAELGDILWYLSILAVDCDIKLDDIAATNLRKLSDRQSRGKLGGSGDNR